VPANLVNHKGCAEIVEDTADESERQRLYGARYRAAKSVFWKSKWTRQGV
jgi:hypothetical protein